MPFTTIGGVKNASTEVALNLEIADGRARFGVYSTSPRAVQVRLTAADAVLYDRSHDLSPAHPLVDVVPLPTNYRPQALCLAVAEGDRELLTFSPLPASTGEPLSLIHI